MIRYAIPAAILLMATPAFAADNAARAAMAAAGKPAPSPSIVGPAAINNQTAVGAQMCFTCGGDWPVFAGAIPTTGNPTERGSGCSGALVARSDSTPFLCSR